jgi:hypothetical protein
VLLVGSLFVRVRGRNHHSFNPKVHHRIEELTNVRRLGAGKKRGIGGHAEAPPDRFLDRFNGNVERALAADGRVVMLPESIQMNGKAEEFGRFEKVELALQEQRVGAEVNVFLARDKARDNFVYLGVDEWFASGNGDHGGAAFFRRPPALLRGEAAVQNVVRVLDFAAPGASEIAAKKRLEHEHERVFPAAL